MTSPGGGVLTEEPPSPVSSPVPLPVTSPIPTPVASPVASPIPSLVASPVAPPPPLLAASPIVVDWRSMLETIEWDLLDYRAIPSLIGGVLRGTNVNEFLERLDVLAYQGRRSFIAVDFFLHKIFQTLARR